ncbi:hypothetical protein CCR75_006019 [Bremia lactucae]|uniref:Uncharacterized protein n=1 Tax=Bremia lactucae TaxID=4779 RepID=A0A976FHZ9_BRELC|nr:hypothetical protein CCR75_000419 [Bremia lactucae]TDH67138.1 hypothetical protein CCR75_006019 [Bremia lactucae]
MEPEQIKVTGPELHDESIQQLWRLEQENDRLNSCVRRFEATKIDLEHKLEQAEEKIVSLQHEVEKAKEGIQPGKEAYLQLCALRAQLKTHKSVLNRLLRVVEIPIKDEIDLLDQSIIDENEQIDMPDSFHVDCNVQTAECRHEWSSKVETLRLKLQAKSDELQTTEDKYEEYRVASFEIERALVRENDTLKRLLCDLHVTKTIVPT